MSLADSSLLAAIILLAYTAQAITGFGSTVLTITLAALFLPIAFVMPIAVVLNLPFCAWIIWRDRVEIDWTLLKRDVLPLMTVGVVAGAASAVSLADINLKRPLGAIVTVLAALELWRLYRRVEYKPSATLRKTLILASGFMQGLYATGGPLLASALAGTHMHRSARRVSLMVVWMVFNTGLTIHYLLNGSFTAQTTQASLWLLPLTAIGLWAGDFLHDRVQETSFRILVNLLLVISGAALLR